MGNQTGRTGPQCTYGAGTKDRCRRSGVPKWNGRCWSHNGERERLEKLLRAVREQESAA